MVTRTGSPHPLFTHLLTALNALPGLPAGFSVAVGGAEASLDDMRISTASLTRCRRESSEAHNNSSWAGESCSSMPVILEAIA